MNKPLLLLVAVFALLALAAPDALATMGAGGGLPYGIRPRKDSGQLDGAYSLHLRPGRDHWLRDRACFGF